AEAAVHPDAAGGSAHEVGRDNDVHRVVACFPEHRNRHAGRYLVDDNQIAPAAAMHHDAVERGEDPRVLDAAVDGHREVRPIVAAAFDLNDVGRAGAGDDQLVAAAGALERRVGGEGL